MMNSSSPTAAAAAPPSKRARCALNGTQKVSCLVDGCSADLSRCREYHRRRRVCEEHTKTPAVFVGGKEKRFCQQCSKFHSLGEFDEGKRSCRKRLDGHNRRRRKPQPGSLFMSSKSFQGTRILQFSIPKIHSSAGVRSRKLSVIGRGQAAVMAADQIQLLDESNEGSQPTETFSWTFNGGRKWFPILPANCPKTGNQVVSEVRFCQPVPDSFVSSEIGKKSHESDENNCALYLLSSHPQLQASGTGLKHLLEPNVIHPVLPVLGADFQVDAAVQMPSSISVMAELVDPVTVPDALETDIKYDGMFHMRPDGLLEIASSATFGYFG